MVIIIIIIIIILINIPYGTLVKIKLNVYIWFMCIICHVYLHVPREGTSL